MLRIYSKKSCVFASLTEGAKSTPTVGFLRRFFYNDVAKTILQPFCYGRFATVKEDLIAGAPEALQYLARHVSTKDFNAINLCTEDSLAKKVKDGLSDKDAVSWEINKVLSTDITTLHVILGAIRGDKVDADLMRSFMGLDYVINNKMIEKFGDRPFSELLGSASDIYKDQMNGVIIQADVLITVEQAINSVQSPEPVNHWLKLEMSIIPHGESSTEFRPTSNPQAEPQLSVAFEPTDWKIVDVNNVMNGNPPIASSA